MQAKISTTETHVFDGAIKRLRLYTTKGQTEILPGHAPMISELAPGPLFVEGEASGGEWFFIQGGFIEVREGDAFIMAEAIERPGEIDSVQVETRLEQSINKLKTGGLDEKATNEQLLSQTRDRGRLKTVALAK